MKKVLLLSGYDAASHKYWRELLANELNEFEWTQIALPDRHFSWRARGNSLTFASEFSEALNRDYDLIIATSMVDLASLRGFKPRLATIPTIVYFHENQFVYPVSNQQPNLLNIQLTTIYSAYCADKLLFNSQYNLDSFVSGVELFCKKIPDGVPDNLAMLLKNKSLILPVPILDKLVSTDNRRSANKNNLPSITWNHRWEYDKQPEVFFKALEKLSAAGVEFDLNVLGQSFRKSPTCFETAKYNLSKHISHWGFLPLEEYQNCLNESDIVVSTAIHEFQGLSMLKAIAAGCTPVAPNRLVYPEYVPEELRYEVSEDPNTEAENLFRLLKDLLKRNTFPRYSVKNFTVSNLIPKYHALFDAMIDGAK